MDAFDPQLRARYQDRLAELNLEHRDLDAAIHRLVQDPWHDQLLVKRLKRRKLLLKRSEEHTSELQSH